MLQENARHIDNAILELLHKHECVIIPGLGGFVSSYRPAYIDANNQIFPPSKSILFNKNLIHNDGLLMNHLSVALSIPYNDANQMVMEFVQKVKSQLSESKRLDLNDIGFFYLNEEGNTLFRQQLKTNLNVHSFGLSSFEVSPVEEENQLIVPVVKEVQSTPVIERDSKQVNRAMPVELQKQNAQVQPEPKKRKKRRAAYIIIPALLLGVSGYSVWVADNTDYFHKSPIQVSDFNPFTRANQIEIKEYKTLHRDVEYTPFEFQDLASFTEKYQPMVEVEEQVFQDVAINEVEDTRENKVANVSSDLKYHVVVGCFSMEDNAEGLVDSYKTEGYAAHVVDKKGGLYRVSMQSFATRSEAKDLLRKIKSEKGISAWVLKK